jgi:hypothetical protein
MPLKVVENIRADIKDIVSTARRIANRHLQSIRGYISGTRLRRW